MVFVMLKTIKIMVSYVNIDIIADIKPPYTHYCCLCSENCHILHIDNSYSLCAPVISIGFPSGSIKVKYQYGEKTLRYRIGVKFFPIPNSTIR